VPDLIVVFLVSTFDWFSRSEIDVKCLPGQVREAGVRLGVSTHNWEELGRALSLRPSYISLGPIFHTNSKVRQKQKMEKNNTSHHFPNNT
jgi:hypothetical protein